MISKTLFLPMRRCIRPRWFDVDHEDYLGAFYA